MQRDISYVWDLQFINAFFTSKLVAVLLSLYQMSDGLEGSVCGNSEHIVLGICLYVHVL